MCCGRTVSLVALLATASGQQHCPHAHADLPAGHSSGSSLLQTRVTPGSADTGYDKDEEGHDYEVHAVEDSAADLEKHDEGPGESADGPQDDAKPTPSPLDDVEESSCHTREETKDKCGSSCPHFDATWSQMDTNKDGKVCGVEYDEYLKHQKTASSPALLEQSTEQRVIYLEHLHKASVARMSTQQCVKRIEGLYKAGRLENHTHMRMLRDVFQKPQHIGELQVGEEDMPGFSQHKADHWGLAEGQPAADGTVVNRTVHFDRAVMLQHKTEKFDNTNPQISFQTFGGTCRTSLPNWVGDGYCDSSLNKRECMYDGGDCCEDTCHDARYKCAKHRFKCKPGASDFVEGNRVSFMDAGLSVHTLRLLYVWAHIVLSHQCHSWNGESLSEGEWFNLMQTFNRGNMYYYKNNCRENGVIQKCGNHQCAKRDLLKTTTLFGHGSKHFGTGLCTRKDDYVWDGEWERCLTVHEVAHNAGYTHGGYGSSSEEWGGCWALGSWYDHCDGDRCKTCAAACENHWKCGASQSCGWGSFGCQAKCVKSSYSMSMTERACWCTRVRRGVRCGAQ